ncbi:hypothetical protein WJX74_000931 [Apatococcus lobatus]|uniref:Regulator of telomere elongation helicase 1 homolog n=1 Tax=Apatococcus lobatus TaxID=904363 RepID=A0AAW1RTX2_9CHLO
MQYDIKGHKVEFPHRAYGVQLAFISKVIKTLDSKENALLEAPTGTGKTLSLLCSALAWQQKQKELIEDERQQKLLLSKSETASASPDEERALGEDKTAGAVHVHRDDEEKLQKRRKPPKIFYATRTHSQIAQVVRELKRTSYRPKMAILASREHYCVHKTVSKKPNRDEECDKLLREDGGCRFYANVGKLFGLQKGRAMRVHDIEDLTKAGKEHKACPYFAARHFADDAEMVFCPYNYLLDPVVRSAMNITVDNAILIFDEAHNIEDTARDAASAELDAGLLLEVHMALQRIIAFGVRTDLYQPMADAIWNLYDWLRALSEGNQLISKGLEASERVWAGKEAMAELRQAGLAEEQVAALLEVYRQMREAEENGQGEGKKGAAPNPAQAAEIPEDTASATQKAGMAGQKVGGLALGVISRLLTVLQLMYEAGAAHAVDYRLMVSRTSASSSSFSNCRGRRGAEGEEDVAKEEAPPIQMCLWCLNPALAFNAMADPAHAILLTSGTLAPLATFASELGAPFENTLEAPHVVNMQKQVRACAIATGPDGFQLQATYRYNNHSAFQDSIGLAILEAAKVVPDGMLVFFPSYSLLDRLCKRWQGSGMWSQINGLKKIICEPRGTGELFDKAMSDYYSAIRRGKGGIFMAVCRGKVSEGLDFTDANARAVLVIGIPFPNVKDTKVGLKKQFNDQGQQTRGLLSGDQWYSQQAFRALNQAIGRCIRHKNDYGAILLIDERYRQPRYQNNLSRWVKGALEVMPDFQSSLDALKAFFRDNEAASLQANNKENLQPAVSKAAASSAAVPALPSRMVSKTVQPGDSHFITPSQPSLAAAWALPGQLRHQRAPAKPEAKAGTKNLAVQQAGKSVGAAFSQAHQAEQAALGIFDFHHPTTPACATSAQNHAPQAAAPAGTSRPLAFELAPISPAETASEPPTPGCGRGAEGVCSSAAPPQDAALPTPASHAASPQLIQQGATQAKPLPVHVHSNSPSPENSPLIARPRLGAKPTSEAQSDSRVALPAGFRPPPLASPVAKPHRTNTTHPLMVHKASTQPCEDAPSQNDGSPCSSPLPARPRPFVPADSLVLGNAAEPDAAHISSHAEAGIFGTLDPGPSAIYGASSWNDPHACHEGPSGSSLQLSHSARAAFRLLGPGSSPAAGTSVWPAQQELCGIAHQPCALAEGKHDPGSSCLALATGDHVEYGGRNDPRHSSARLYSHASEMLQQPDQACCGTKSAPVASHTFMGADACGVFDEPEQHQDVDGASFPEFKGGKRPSDSTQRCTMDAGPHLQEHRGEIHAEQQAAHYSLPSAAVGNASASLQAHCNQQQHQHASTGPLALSDFHTPPHCNAHAHTPFAPISTCLQAPAARHLRGNSPASASHIGFPDAQRMPDRASTPEAVRITPLPPFIRYPPLSAGMSDHHGRASRTEGASQELPRRSMMRAGPQGRHSLPPAASTRFKPVDNCPSAPSRMQQPLGTKGSVSGGATQQHTIQIPEDAAKFQADAAGCRIPGNHMPSQLHPAPYQIKADTLNIGNRHIADGNASQDMVEPDWPCDIPQLQPAAAQAMLHGLVQLPASTAGDMPAKVQLANQQCPAAEPVDHKGTRPVHPQQAAALARSAQSSRPEVGMLQDISSQHPAGQIRMRLEAQPFQMQPRNLDCCAAGQNPQMSLMPEPHHPMQQSQQQIIQDQAWHGQHPVQTHQMRPGSAGMTAGATALLPPHSQQQQNHLEKEPAKQGWHTPDNARPLKRQHSIPSGSWPPAEARGFQAPSSSSLKTAASLPACNSKRSHPDSSFHQTSSAQGVFGSIADGPAADIAGVLEAMSSDPSNRADAEDGPGICDDQTAPEPSVEVVVEWIKRDLAELEAFLLEQPRHNPEDPPDFEDVKKTARLGLIEPFVIARESLAETQDLRRLYSWSAPLPEGMRLLLIAHASITGVEPAFELNPSTQRYVVACASRSLPAAIQWLENLCKEAMDSLVQPVSSSHCPHTMSAGLPSAVPSHHEFPASGPQSPPHQSVYDARHF